MENLVVLCISIIFHLKEVYSMYSQSIPITIMMMVSQISNQDKQLLSFSCFSVKTTFVQLITNDTANTVCHGSILNFTCSVGCANPQVTSYHLLENGFSVATSSSGIWIRMMSSSGSFNYKCLCEPYCWRYFFKCRIRKLCFYGCTLTISVSIPLC